MLFSVYIGNSIVILFEITSNTRDCPSSQILLNGACVKECPYGYYTQQEYIHGITEETLKTCVACHYTCKGCDGPRDYQCNICYGDSDLDNNYCRQRAQQLQLRESARWYTTMIIAFVILCFITIILVVLVILERKLYLSNCLKKNTKYSKLPMKTLNHVNIENKASIVFYHNEDTSNIKQYYDRDNEI